MVSLRVSELVLSCSAALSPAPLTLPPKQARPQGPGGRQWTRAAARRNFENHTNLVLTALNFLRWLRRPAVDVEALTRLPSEWHRGIYHRFGWSARACSSTGVLLAGGREGAATLEHLERLERLGRRAAGPEDPYTSGSATRLQPPPQGVHKPMDAERPSFQLI